MDQSRIEGQELGRECESRVKRSQMPPVMLHLKSMSDQTRTIYVVNCRNLICSLCGMDVTSILYHHSEYFQ